MRIELEKIGLQFPEKPPLFQNVCLALESGDFVLLQGPSGCGKSSLLRLLNRLQEPTSGRILFDGRLVADHQTCALRRRIAYVQQTPVMVPGTVEDNLILPFTFKVLRGTSAPSQADLRRWLEDFLLDGVRLDDDASTLSLGQQQRLALIRILLVEPEFVLCDEPTSALDPQSREIVEHWLEKTNLERRIGILLVTHLDFTVGGVAPRKLTVSDGLIRESMA